jgi:hypothetical protein
MTFIMNIDIKTKSIIGQNYITDIRNTQVTLQW